jgi:hypothetical protein
MGFVIINIYMNKKYLSPKEWLNKNCEDDDWDDLHEGLKDFMSTNNIVRYMEKYSEYIRGNTI